MEYFFKPSALRSLKRLPKADQVRVLKKLEFFFSQEHPLQFAKPIKDKTLGSFRFRIGDIRAIFDVEQHRAFILFIGNRKDIYR